VKVSGHVMKVAALFFVTVFMLSAYGFASNNVAKADLRAGTATPMPALSESEMEKKIVLALENYAIKQQEIAEYKEILKEKGCQEINLEICAAGLYARNKSDGFKDPQAFDQWQKTILGDYVTDEQIYEFGRTGKGLDVVYFRDKNGKKTKEPAIFYVATPDVKKFKISDIEKAIDFWEKPAPGFLRAAVANGVRFLFQGQASSNKDIVVFKFKWGIVYYNYCENDLSHFILGLKKGLAVEMFGEKADALGIYSKDEVGVIKSWLARDCCIYIGKKTGHKNIADRAGAFQKALDRYMSGGNLTYEYMDPIIKTIKKEGLITPFGAETWEEIDSAI